MRIVVLGLMAACSLFAQPKVVNPEDGQIFVVQTHGSGVADAFIEESVQAQASADSKLLLRWAFTTSYQTRGKFFLNGTPAASYSEPDQSKVVTLPRNQAGEIKILTGQYGSFYGPAAITTNGVGFDTLPLRASIESLIQFLYVKTSGYNSLASYQKLNPATDSDGNPILADPHLPSCIPAAESNYRQFVPFEHPKYGVTDWWPYDNKDAKGGGGGYVGLMQVKTTMASAFNWTANVQAGVLEFSDKIRVALIYMSNLVGLNAGLSKKKLTVSQLEEVALGYYSGLGDKEHGKPYWILDTLSPGGKEWVMSDNPKVQAYVAKVRACQ